MEIPGYKIIDTLGEGGMATVYLAIQESFEREVALKVMSSSLNKDPSFGERFLREARIVARLVHPNIVTVYDVGVHEGHHYLSMEYVPGDDLKASRYHLSLAQAVNVVKDIARALDYAGRKGYVHRDVKPENIMLHKEDSRAVLMDFGIARATDVASGMTQTGTTMGTPHYMSPEQAKGAQVDPRSDIYSLGVVLFQLLAGRVPFDADSAVAVGIMHISDSVPSLPEPLTAFQPIIDRALAKQQDNRYQNGSELIADIDSISATAISDMAEQMAAQPVINDVDDHAATLVGVATQAETQVAQETVSSEPISAHDSFHIGPNDSIGDYNSAAEARSAQALEEPASRSVARTLMVLVGCLAVSAGGWYAWQWWQARQSSSIPGLHFAAHSATATLEHGVKSSVPATLPLVASDTTKAIMAQASSARVRRAKNQQKAAVAAWAAPIEGLDNAAISSQVASREHLASLGHKAITQALAAGVERELQAKNTSRAAQLARALRETAPNTERDTRYAKQVKRQQHRAQEAAVAQRLAQAQSYVDHNALTRPPEANAVAAYKAILAEYPDNADAQAGLQAVAARFADLAQSALDNAELSKAKGYTAKGLTLAPRNTHLQTLSTQVAQRQAQKARRQQQLQAKIQQLQTRAQQQMAAHKLIAPADNNALATFNQLLTVAPDNTQAKQGIETIQQRLLASIDAMLARKALDNAAVKLSSARDKFPQNQAFLGLQAKLDQLIEASRPAIAKVAVAAQPFNSLQTPQATRLSPDRVIYIGFQYTHLQESTSVIQARLYDGSRSVQLAQVPVVVSGSDGTKFFRIERPVAGFASGGYHIDLMLGGQRLKTLAFKVTP